MHNIKRLLPHSVLVVLKEAKGQYYFSKLLNLLNVNSGLFLRCGLEVSHSLSVRNSLIFYFLSVASGPLYSRTLNSIRNLVIILVRSERECGLLH
jgi:hypothetical protein